MYKKGIYKILTNEPLTDAVWRMTLAGDTQWISAPGQFVNIALEGKYLRRPISICDYDNRSIALIYKVVGGGTEQMSRMAAGAELDLLVGLGNGFDVAACGETTLLSGGGIGTAPLFGLAKRLLAAGKTPVAVLGFNTAEDVFYENEFKALGVQTVIATADGSCGTRGFVTDALLEQFDTVCACGPMPMLRALCARTEKPGFLSLEARMGCGFGACMGCTIETAHGPKRICKEGPVFRKEELIW